MSSKYQILHIMSSLTLAKRNGMESTKKKCWNPWGNKRYEVIKTSKSLAGGAGVLKIDTVSEPQLVGQLIFTFVYEGWYVQPGGFVTFSGYLAYHQLDASITTLPSSQSLTLNDNIRDSYTLCKQDPRAEVYVTVFSDTNVHVSYGMWTSGFSALIVWVVPLLFFPLWWIYLYFRYIKPARQNENEDAETRRTQPPEIAEAWEGEGIQRGDRLDNESIRSRNEANEVEQPPPDFHPKGRSTQAQIQAEAQAVLSNNVRKSTKVREVKQTPHTQSSRHQDSIEMSDINRDSTDAGLNTVDTPAQGNDSEVMHEDELKMWRQRFQTIQLSAPKR